MRISRDIVHDYADKKAMKALAFALKVKATYTNSIVYNASLHNLSQTFKLDRRTIKKYLTTLEQDELVVYQNGSDLKFKKLYSENKYHYGIRNTLLQESSIIEIEKLLYGTMLKDRWRVQKNAIKAKKELIKGHSWGFNKSVRYYQALARQFNLNFSDYNLNAPESNKKRLINQNVQLTIKTISIEFNLSIQKTYEVLRFLVSQGILEIKRNITHVKKVFNKYEAEALMEKGKTYFMKDNHLFYVQANTYSFINNPQE